MRPIYISIFILTYNNRSLALTDYIYPYSFLFATFQPMGASSPCHTCRAKQSTGQKIKVTENLIIYKLKPNLNPDPQPEISPENHQLYKQNHKMLPGTKIYIKVPSKMGEKTAFKWIQQNKWTYPLSIKDLSPDFISRRSFQQKNQWFKLKLEERKISWRKGADNIFVDRTNILISSYEQLQKLNITKEIKVNFTDQKGQNDAGGIFRQWLNLCMKEICSIQFGILKLCDTDETNYKFSLNETIIQQCLNTCKLLGYLIAKSLMQRVPLNCHFNHTIWRQILQQRITIDDIYSYDKDFYKHWKSILQNKGLVEHLYLNFSVVVKDEISKKSKVFELIPNGKKTAVTEQNKEQFIKKLIEFYCIKRPAKAIQNIKLTLFEIIPAQYLAVFQPYEIDCLLCGQENIDLEDWKTHTIYEGYKENDKQIEWFWKILNKLQKPMLKNFLHYCTGCSRVPVLGFQFLQSNRGEIKKFTIRKVEYQSGNPYPKSYTCFNRLELPEYKNYQEFENRMYTICSEEINEINIDA